jgi:hypothetical protein
VPADAALEMQRRLPEPESLLLLARRNPTFLTFADLREASIGIGPEGSGAAYLLRQLFQDPDLQGWVSGSPTTSGRPSPTGQSGRVRISLLS